MITMIYWSGTGNTKAMAEFIEQGIKEEGKEVTVKVVSEATTEDVTNSDVLILGCPSMGAEELEEAEMEPFIESIAGKVTGKKVALFGSYGWGSGEWMETWEDRMDGYHANVMLEPLIVNEAPEGDEAMKCVAYGKNIAKMI